MIWPMVKGEKVILEKPRRQRKHYGGKSVNCRAMDGGGAAHFQVTFNTAPTFPKTFSSQRMEHLKKTKAVQVVDLTAFVQSGVDGGLNEH